MAASPAPAESVLPSVGSPLSATLASASDFAPGELLVKFQAGTDSAIIQGLLSEQGSQEIGKIPVLGVSKLRLPQAASVGQVAAAYRQNRNVLYAEPNYLGT